MRKSRNNFLVSIIIVLLLIFISCSEKIIYKYDDTNPAVVVQPDVIEVKDTSAVIYWETNEPTNAVIEYWFDSGDVREYIEEENSQIHRVKIGGLEPFMTYYYRLKIWDYYENGPVKTEIDSFHTLHNIHSFLRVGWSFFTEADYDSARFYFYGAFNKNTFYPFCHASIGWHRIYNDSLIAAKSSLIRSVELNNYLKIGLAGLALVYIIEANVDSSIFYGEKVLNFDPNWEFRYCKKIDANTVRVILLEPYFKKGNFTRVKALIDQVWPGNGIQIDIPSTWIVEGREYKSYEETLLAAINYLRKKYLEMPITEE